MLTCFEIETPFLNDEDTWARLSVSADVTAYGYDELEVRDERDDLLKFEDLPERVRTVINLKLHNWVLEERLSAGRTLSALELIYERS